MLLTDDTPSIRIAQVICCEGFSSLRQLLRVTTCDKRFEIAQVQDMEIGSTIKPGADSTDSGKYTGS